MPYSALNRAATSEWCTPSTVNVAIGSVGVSRPGPSTVTPGIAARAERSCVASSSSWSFDRPPSDPVELVDGRVERDGTDDVGGAGFFTLGRIGPHDLVEIDEIDGAAASEERVAVGEGAPRSDEGAGAEGRVHLVPAPRDEVDRRRERPMGCELGGIDEHRDRHARGPLR